MKELNDILSSLGDKYFIVNELNKAKVIQDIVCYNEELIIALLKNDLVKKHYARKNGEYILIKTGIIYCSEIGRISEIINGTFDTTPLPQKVNGKDVLILDNMKVIFSKYIYSRNTTKIGNNIDFILYFPVERVLTKGKEKYLISLLNDIKNTASTKVIVMTTNDQLKNLTPIRDVVDSHIHYEIENDNPELLEIIKSNIGSRLFVKNDG